MTRLMIAGLVLAAACGGDDGGGNTMIDAPRMIDAAANKVVTVTCPSTTVPTVMTTDASFSYMPSATTISVNGIVKFVMSSSHNVVPNSITTTDPGLTVSFGQTKCLQFTVAGTFGFACGPHSFAGTITVQ